MAKTTDKSDVSLDNEKKTIVDSYTKSGWSVQDTSEMGVVFSSAALRVNPSTGVASPVKTQEDARKNTLTKAFHSLFRARRLGPAAGTQKA